MKISIPVQCLTLNKKMKQEAFRERRHLHVCDLLPWRVTLTLHQGQKSSCHLMSLIVLYLDTRYEVCECKILWLVHFFVWITLPTLCECLVRPGITVGRTLDLWLRCTGKCQRGNSARFVIRKQTSRLKCYKQSKQEHLSRHRASQSIRFAWYVKLMHDLWRNETRRGHFIC